MGERVLTSATLASVEGLGPDSYGEAFADVYDRWYADLGDGTDLAAHVAAHRGDGNAVRGANDIATEGTQARHLEAAVGVGAGVALGRRNPVRIHRVGDLSQGVVAQQDLGVRQRGSALVDQE